jgi:hypothetical protein
VAVAHGDATISLTAIPFGGRAHVWEWLYSFPFSLAFTPDGKTLVAGQREGGLRTFPVPR